MPRYYCDYCDTYLTHDSPSVRKQHNAGYKHKANVRTYYQQYEAQLNQSLIDQKVKEHLGAAAFRPPVGPPYNVMRPGMPGFPTPQMTFPGQMPPGPPLIPGIRPPVFARPPMPGAPPGYMPMPNMPQMMAPHSAPLPGQLNGLQRPLSAPQPMVPGSTGIPASSPMFAPPPPPPPYQGNITTPPTASVENSNANAPSP